MSLRVLQLALTAWDSRPVRVMRKVPVTILLSVFMVALSVISYKFGLFGSIRAQFGFDPTSSITYFTSFFLHADGPHSSRNVFVFVLFGVFAELWFGRLRYFVLCISMGVFLGVLTVALLPAYYPAADKPVGFSGVSYFTLPLGVYSALMIASSRRCGVRWLSSFSAFILDGRFSCFAIPGLRVLGIFLALLILVVVVVDNYGNSDAASKLVHSSGALAGAMVSLLDLVFRNGVGKGSFGPNKRGGRFCLDSAGVHTKTPPRCCAIDHSRTKERPVP